MEITEVIGMSDKILGRLTEDAGSVAPKQKTDPLAVGVDRAENSTTAPLKKTIDNSRQKELDLETKLKKVNQSMSYVTNPEQLSNLRMSKQNMQTKIAELKSGRKQDRIAMQSLQDSADIPDPSEKDMADEETDDDLKKDAKEFDADVKEESVIDISESDVNITGVEKAKANAVIKVCENEKNKLKTAENEKINTVKEAVARRVATIDQKEEAAKAIKEKSQSKEILSAEQKQAQTDAANTDSAVSGQEQESMQLDDGSAQIQEAFENIRSHIIHSKIDRLTAKANAIKEKLKGNIKPEKADKLNKKLDEINAKLIKLTGFDTDGKQVSDMSGTPYGKLNRDINAKNSNRIANGFEKEESYEMDDGIDALLEECDVLLNEADEPDKAEAIPAAKETEKKPELMGLAKHIYDHAIGNTACKDAKCCEICDLVKNSPDGKATIAKIKAELSKDSPSKKTLTLLKADLERIYGYAEKQAK
jgi:hypothetical protein